MLPLTHSLKMIWASCSPPGAAPQQLACPSAHNKRTFISLHATRATPCTLAMRHMQTEGQPERARQKPWCPMAKHDMRHACNCSCTQPARNTPTSSARQSHRRCHAWSCIHTCAVHAYVQSVTPARYRGSKLLQAQQAQQQQHDMLD
jgi:hypothetical protein